MMVFLLRLEFLVTVVLVGINGVAGLSSTQDLFTN